MMVRLYEILFLRHQKDSAELTSKSAVPSLVPWFCPSVCRLQISQEILVKLITCSDVPGCWVDAGGEEWYILLVQLWGGFLNWRNVTKTDLMLSRHSVTPWSVVVIG